MAKKKNITKMKCPSVFNQNEGQTNAHKIKCRVLIVCEGLKTEPNYFKSFHMMENSGGLVFEITNAGGGINTIKVVQKAIELRDKAIGDKKPYDITWAVFDKDSFDADKFDNAIKMANSNGIRCAWSNEAFELWYIYHFENRITPMSRNEYAHKITTLVREKQKLKTGKKSTFVYKKNDPEMRSILLGCGCNEQQAIRWAKEQSESFDAQDYHSHNPCTKVYELVELLLGEDKVFNEKIRAIMTKRGCKQ